MNKCNKTPQYSSDQRLKQESTLEREREFIKVGLTGSTVIKRVCFISTFIFSELSDSKID